MWIFLVLIIFFSFSRFSIISTDSLTIKHDGVPTNERPDLSTLVHVHALWRHGDRTPAVFIPSDIANDVKSWNNEIAELTTKGIQEHYYLGVWLRKRYDGFLSRRYSPAEVYIRSSDFNRTLMSAQANLAGLFPPYGDQIWNRDILWQPIPIHTVRKEEDTQLYESIECPVAEQEFNKIFTQNEEVKKIEEENAEFLNFVRDHGGYKAGKFSLLDIWEVYDPLNAELNHKDQHSLPSWVNSTVWQKIIDLFELSTRFYYANPVLQRLRGGTLLKEIIDRLNLIRSNSTSEKFTAYSAHDMTLAVFLTMLGANQDSFPDYASLILLETHFSQDVYSLKLFYKNSSSSDQIFEYEIEDCVKPCTIEKFNRRSEKFIPIDWHRECGLRGFSISFAGVFWLMFGVTLVLLAISIYLILLNLRNKHSYKKLSVSPNSDYFIDTSSP